jgi:serine/threonine-protein kinase
VGPYELLFPIASGGMATVYLARKRGAGGFEKTTALKLTHAHLRSDPNWASELVEEAKLASLVQHPNVVRVHDVEDDPHGVFLVMDYVEGDTLGGLIAKAVRQGDRLPHAIALRILDDALRGLHAVHELRDAADAPLGVVHRDFTPQNILVGVDGRARLTDFGVAKAATRLSFTSTGLVKGKTGYMAPEQIRGVTLDRRCDVYAAGVVAWEALSGRRMANLDMDPVAALVDAATREAPRLRDVWPEAPPALDEAIAGALALDCARRWPTAEAFRDCLVKTGGVAPADHASVAEYVQMVAGEHLETRRSKIAAIVAERQSARPPAQPAMRDATLEPTMTLPGLPRPSGVPRAALALVLGCVVTAVVAGALWRRRAHTESAAGSASASTLTATATPTPTPPTAAAAADTGTPPPEPATEPAPPASRAGASPSASTPPRIHGKRGKPSPATPAQAASVPAATTPPPPEATTAGKPLAPSPYE